jgi:hypothetical protein
MVRGRRPESVTRMNDQSEATVYKPPKRSLRQPRAPGFSPLQSDRLIKHQAISGKRLIPNNVQAACAECSGFARASSH